MGIPTFTIYRACIFMYAEDHFDDRLPIILLQIYCLPSFTNYVSTVTVYAIIM